MRLSNLYSQNGSINLLARSMNNLHNEFVVTPVQIANGNVIFICNVYALVLLQEQ